MTSADRSQWPLTPSQQEVYRAVRAVFVRLQGNQRPFLLTGETGVGKSFLARRLANADTAVYDISAAHMGELLSSHSLHELAPEVVVRFVKGLVERSPAPYAILDGFEPLISLWAVERPRVLPNFFAALGRAIMDRPVVVMVRTSAEHLPLGRFKDDILWPSERCFRLELTLEDQEVVAVNWELDPMRARTSANLYELLAVRLTR